MTKISEVQFVPIQQKDGLVGFASFIYNSELKISNIGVHVNLQGEIRLVFPGNKFGSYIFPIKKDLGSEIKDAINIKYQDILNIQRGDLKND